MSDRWRSGEYRSSVGIDAVRPALSRGCCARDDSAIIGAMSVRFITGPVRAFLTCLVILGRGDEAKKLAATYLDAASSPE